MNNNWILTLKDAFRYLFLFCLLIAKASCFATKAPNIWNVLRQQFTLNHQVTQPEVQHQLRWLIAHPSYLNSLAQSKPYIYHILTKITARHLPGELALIPMIESSYDPFAYSGAGAAGLWQLMPGTGTDLGLKQDWWSDARRSIGPSTDAALNYLVYLNHFFHGDWILAIAAYDSGEGTMARIIKNSKNNRRNNHKNNINFWTLNVPSETKAYVPRLLALAEIIQNPDRYHIKLPNIAHEPYFQEVNIGHQIDLNSAAKLAGISYHDLLKLNPGFNHWTTAPYQPYKLLIPMDHVNKFRNNLAHFNFKNFKNLNFAKSKDIKQKSQQKSHFTLLTAAYKRIHIVQKNDSFAKLERKYGIDSSHIRHWNHLSANARLKIGQALIIWKNTTGSRTA